MENHMRHKASTGREVLAFLESNDLEATPSNYRLGYVFVTAGCNRLVQEINGYIDDKLRIKQANMDDMMERLGADGHDPSTEGVKVSEGGDVEEEDAERFRKKLKESSKRIKRLQTDLEEARNTATVDELTGLRNRRAAKQLMETLDAETGQYALAVIDIDNFKRINDTFGHPVGDRVIAHVGRVLSDSVAPEMVARWGGEEFLVVSREMSCAQMHDKLDEARRHLRERHLKVRETDRPLGTITFSAGISPSSGNSTECVEIADGLLYEAKQNGRDQIRSSSKLKAA